MTGFRVGELAALTVGDVDTGRGPVTVRVSKAKARTVTLSTAALELFKTQRQDKLPAAPLFARENGEHWRSADDWRKPFKAQITRAGLRAHMVPYHLKHAAFSMLIGAGVDVLSVARMVGTSITMVDKHYGHLRHEDTRTRRDRVQLVA